MTQPITRLESHLADRYRIERELGQGGMATVYLAEDVRHHRKVAIKVLHPELSAVLGPERFLKEIELTANLQHPHILPLFDSGSADGLLYYVMPYVEGETLRRRLDREQQLPIQDALRIASEVAEALEYAHRRGVVHRDVKPENILLHDGRPLVADFGIALAVQQAGGARMTQTGMSLGTPQYMAPEQAMGDKSVDHRADIYALGAVAYEMLTGEPPFTGPNSQAIVAKVLTTDPTPLQVKRRSVPSHVEEAVLTALEKMPADRFASAGDFRIALTGGADPTRRAATARRSTSDARASRFDRARLPVAAAAIVLLAAIAAASLMRGAGAGTGAAPVRFAYALGSPGLDRAYIAISPDGRRILQSVADTAGVIRIMMRDLASVEPAPIPGTELGMDPDFSPDGAWIAFVADGRLVTVPASGGPRRELADSASPGGTAWMADGSVIFTHARTRSLWRAGRAGGSVQVTQLDTARREFTHWSPQLLPGDRAVIYTSYATPISRARIEAYEFASGRTTVLVEGAIFGRYAPSGHLLYARDGAIFAVPFDAARLEVRGTAVPVQDDVYWNQTDGLAGYAVSPNGNLVYISATGWNVENRVVWVDRSGREQPALPTAGPYAEPRISPDGRRIALTVEQPRREIWVYEIARGVLTRVARSDGVAFNAVWMPDSRSVIYTHEDPVYDLHSVPVDGSAANQAMVTSPRDKYASGVSPDGRFLAYTEADIDDGIYIVPLADAAKSRALPLGRGSKRNAVFSPAGRWVAYDEIAQGRSNVYVAAMDGSGGRRQVSIDDGAQPRWTRGGREIVYRRGNAIMAVAIDPLSSEAGHPVELFRMVQHRGLGAGRTLGYDVTPDGNRFLLVTPVQRTGVQPTIVVLNWFEELRAKVRR